jgi:hypothetical protein
VIPKRHPPPTASRQLEFDERQTANVSGVSGGERSHLAPESASRELRRKDFGVKTRAPHKTFGPNAVPETGGLGDRSRNLSADTIAVEIDLVRRPFQVLLRSHPINFALSHLISQSTRMSHTHTALHSVAIRLHSGRLHRLALIGVRSRATRHYASAAAWEQGASNGEQGKAHASLDPRPVLFPCFRNIPT